MTLRKMRWYIPVFIAPAMGVYTIFMVLPLLDSLRMSFYDTLTIGGEQVFVGWKNYAILFTDPYMSEKFWNALSNNFYFFAIHMLVQNPLGILLAVLLSTPTLLGRHTYRVIFFVPAMLSIALVGFVWQLILSPLWGVSETILSHLGLVDWFMPWLGQKETALTTLSLISVWQWVDIPMMLIYAAMLAIPGDLLEAARCDGAGEWRIFWGIKLPLLFPTIGIVSILTFVGNFNAFDLIYVTQGTMAGPDFSTDLLGTYMFRTFYGTQDDSGTIYVGAAIATVMFFIILTGVVLYLFGVQRRLLRYQF